MNNVLECKGIEKTYRDGARELRILRGVDLAVPEGKVTAITGASGAGKSTFLQALSGRASGGVLAGAVSLDGFAFAPGSRRFRRAVAFVAQDDGATHAPELTCGETLDIAAALRRPREPRAARGSRGPRAEAGAART